MTAALHRDEKGEENSLDFFIRARGREREEPLDEVEGTETSEKRQRKREETKTLYPRTVARAKKTRFNDSMETMSKESLIISIAYKKRKYILLILYFLKSIFSKKKHEKIFFIQEK